MVPSGFIVACRFAGSPTSLWPSLVNATKDGKALPLATPAPSALGIMTGLPASITAAAEFDVPRSIPIILAMFSSEFYDIHIPLPPRHKSYPQPTYEVEVAL